MPVPVPKELPAVLLSPWTQNAISAQSTSLHASLVLSYGTMAARHTKSSAPSPYEYTVHPQFSIHILPIPTKEA